MREIPLANGKGVAVVDDEDFERVAAHRWTLMRQALGHREHRYALTQIDHVTVYMHRLVIGAPAGIRVDHVDCDGLNNRRANLRLCDQSQNGGNHRAWGRPTASGFKGVHRVRKKWRAEIMVRRERFNLGNYETPEEAARVYDAAARHHFGAFARLNFPRAGEQSAAA